MNLKRIAGAALAALMISAGVAVPVSAAQAKPNPAVVTTAPPTTPHRKASPTEEAAAKAKQGPKGSVPKGHGPVFSERDKTGRAGTSTRASHLPSTGIEYIYAGGHQFVSDVASKGDVTNVTIAKPFLDTDFHTLAELAVQSADGQQIVEVGWTVDPSVNGGSKDPHLFVYHWVDGAGSCYNACGWVDDAANTTYNAGTNLLSKVGTNITMGIENVAGDWKIWVNDGTINAWIGWFPGSLWNGATTDPFNTTGLIQNFGELASDRHLPCTDMGNGVGPAGTAATFGSYSYHDGTGWVNGDYTTTVNAEYAGGGSPPTSAYDATLNAGSVRTFEWGGPGHDSIGGTPGTTGSCAPATAGTAPAATMQFWKEGPCPDTGTLGCNAGLALTAGSTTLNLCTAVPAGTTIWGYKNNSGVSGRSYQMYRAAGGTCTGSTWGITNASQGLPPAGWGGQVVTAFKRIG